MGYVGSHYQEVNSTNVEKMRVFYDFNTQTLNPVVTDASLIVNPKHPGDVTCVRADAATAAGDVRW